jgi:uncharacterized membrane protein (UPF0136 family)
VIKNWPLSWFVMFGLLAWGLPGAVFLGPLAVELTVLTILPILVLCWHDRYELLAANDEQRAGDLEVSTDVSLALMIGAVLYFFFDAAFGRQLLNVNMFLNHASLDKVIEQANQNTGQGRGLLDLLGGLFDFMPFVLVDMARHSKRALRLPMFLIAALYIFYQVGIGRGFLVMACFALFAGSVRINLFRLLLLGGAVLSIFQAASIVRGDFGGGGFSNPVVEGIAVPYLNLALLHEASCGAGTAFGFVGQFFQKFLPAFLFQKDIFPFNVQMTLCLYPNASDEVTSISVFTYLGELIYYRPNALVALLAGTIAAIEIKIASKILNLLQLSSTRIFVGLMVVLLLRSRIQDVYSYLLFFIVFGTAVALPRLIELFPLGKILTPAAAGRTDGSISLPAGSDSGNPGQ